MNIPDKLLIDVEKTNNVAGYPIISKDGKEIQYVISGKMIISVSENDHKNKIYNLLEENCDLFFCTSEKMDDFLFYPVPMLAIFAVDSKGNRFGTIGYMGGFGSDNYPIGYINQEGVYGKISSSFKEFLELVTYFPYWRNIVEYEQTEVAYNLADIEMKKREKNSQFYANQREISETLELSKNPKSIELLIANIKSPPDFVVYSSINQAKNENTFVEDIIFVE